MTGIAARAAAAAFALGLSLAGPAATAAADTDRPGDDPAGRETSAAPGAESPAAVSLRPAQRARPAADAAGRDEPAAAGPRRARAVDAPSRAADRSGPGEIGTAPDRARQALAGGPAAPAGDDSRTSAPPPGTDTPAAASRPAEPGEPEAGATADESDPAPPPVQEPPAAQPAGATAAVVDPVARAAADVADPRDPPAPAPAAALVGSPGEVVGADSVADVLNDLFAPIRAFLEGIALLVRRTFFNQAPTVSPVQTTGQVSGPITGTIGAVDPEGDPISYTVERAPVAGSVVVAPEGGFTYTPGDGFRGADSFAVTATDGGGFRINLLDPFRAPGTVATVLVSQGESANRLRLEFVYDSGASLWNSSARSALESAAFLLASTFEVSAPVTLTYRVNASFSPLSGTLASANSSFAGPGPGILGTVVQQKVITGLDANGTAPDGTLDWNLGMNWAFGDTVGAYQYDFQSVAVHELLHTFGFLSNVNPAGANTGRNWTLFDGFLVDSGGSSAISDDFRWRTAFDPNLTGGRGGLYFGGSNAVAAYGRPVPLYTPNPWESGSSVSHLDDRTFTGARDQLMNARVSTGPGLRTLSPIERGILADLGYTLAPAPGGAALLLLLVITRRRPDSRSSPAAPAVAPHTWR